MTETYKTDGKSLTLIGMPPRREEIPSCFIAAFEALMKEEINSSNSAPLMIGSRMLRLTLKISDRTQF